MSVAWQQQIFAFDVRYNSHRAINHPTFRTLYIRRRNQLLKEHCGNKNPDFWRQYLIIRSQLLQNHYAVAVDQTSLKKQSVSSRVSPESMLCSHENSPTPHKEDDSGSPNKDAATSSKMAANSALKEKISFVGIHHIFDQHVSAVTMVKFANNDRSRLCCVSHDNTISICNVLSSPPLVLCVLKRHTKPVTGCDWSASNDLVVSCGMDGLLCLWNSTNFACLRAVSEPKPAPLLSCLFNPVNNNYVLAGNSKGEVEVLNISTGIKQKRSTMGGKVLSLAFESSGNLLWAGNDQGIILSFYFDMTNGKLRKLRRVYLGEMAAVTSINYRAWTSPEASEPSLLVNLSANSVRLYRVKDRQGLLELKKRYTIKHKSQHYPIHSIFCPVTSFRLGAYIVTGSEDSSVYFIDIQEEVESKAIVNRLQGHASTVLGVSFNYDRSFLATSDYQGLVILWNWSQ